MQYGLEERRTFLKEKVIWMKLTMQIGYTEFTQHPTAESRRRYVQALSDYITAQITLEAIS